MDYQQIESAQKAQIIDKILLKGEDAIDEYKHVFGVFDFNKVKQLIRDNTTVNTFLAESSVCTDDDKKREIRKILRDMSLNMQEHPFLNDFMDEFVKKGMQAIDNYKEFFGIKYESKLRDKVDKSQKLKKFMRSLSQSSDSDAPSAQMRKELKKLDYDPQNEPWLEAFLQEFTSQGEKAIDTYQTKFGAKVTARLKKSLLSNDTLKAASSLTPLLENSDPTRLELTRVLAELNYHIKESEEWVARFVQSFLDKGHFAFDDYEAKFGAKDAAKLKMAIQNNATLCHLKHPEATKMARSKTERQNSGKTKEEGGEVRTREESCKTGEEVGAELEKVLATFDYTQDNCEWLSELLKKFTSHGLASLDEFKEKFGQKDFKRVRECIGNHAPLLAYSKSITQVDSLPDSEVPTRPDDVRKEIQKILASIQIKNGAEFVDEFVKRGFACLADFELFFSDQYKNLCSRVYKNSVLMAYNDNLGAPLSPLKTKQNKVNIEIAL